MTNPSSPHSTSKERLEVASCSFWKTYYDSLLKLHINTSKKLVTEPVKNRNLQTTNARHVVQFERFWAEELALALGVRREEVGPREYEFRSYRSKKFDVCYPLTGEPKIVISIKSMQNAYRNMTNRIEEAIGDSAVTRLYKMKAAFGFFFFVLDGKVARGQAVQGTGPSGSVPPFLELIEEGGDFFDLTEVANHQRPAPVRPRKPPARQDDIERARLSLADLVHPTIQEEPAIQYDAMAFQPTKIAPADATRDNWTATLTPVAAPLDYATFIQRLVDTARLRGLIT